MKPLFSLAAIVAALVAVPIGSAAPTEAKPAANFTLTDSAGKKWTLHDQKAKTVAVAFLSPDCPMSNGYIPILAEASAKYAEKGVTLIGVYPDPDVTAAQAAAHVKEYKITFPVFRDPEQAAVASLGAKTTPEVFVLDAKFTVRYRGRIDDGYSARLKQKPVISRHDLTIALDEVLAGKEVSLPETKAFGCPITILEKKANAAETKVTFYKDMLPIFQNHCQTCHRPGQVGPFALTTYKEAAKWGDLCLEEVKAKHMPPWKPAPNPLLAHERTLPADAAKVLEKWVSQGMLEGDAKDAPPAPKFAVGWTLGEPDLILEAPADTTVAAAGPDAFRVIVFPTDLPEDKYIMAVEVKPGNPRVVHHTLQLADTSGRARKLQEAAEKSNKEKADRGPGYGVSMGWGFLPDPAGMLGGWAPGLLPKPLPDGVAMKLPKGADICLQIHYHRTGKVETDRTKIGLYFTKKPVTQSFKTIPVTGIFSTIPAGDKEFHVDSSWKLTEDVTAYRVVPHMHLLGKEIELTMTPPGGEEQQLIRIPAWDYNWQEQYEFKEPMKLAKGTILRVQATYDNSAENPNNPHSPPKAVRFGEQTTDEMCFAFLGVASPGRLARPLLPVGKK